MSNESPNANGRDQMPDKSHPEGDERDIQQQPNDDVRDYDPSPVQRKDIPATTNSEDLDKAHRTTM